MMISIRDKQTGTYDDVSISLCGVDLKAHCRLVIFVGNEQKIKCVCTWRIAKNRVKSFAPIRRIDWRPTLLSTAPSAMKMMQLNQSLNKIHKTIDSRADTDTRLVYIYTLDCPLTGRIKYVGQTMSPKNRLAAHIRHPCTLRLSKWIGDLAMSGSEPVMKIIDTATGKPDANRKELYWINRFKDEGIYLLNAINPPAGLACATSE